MSIVTGSLLPGKPGSCGVVTMPVTHGLTRYGLNVVPRKRHRGAVGQQGLRLGIQLGALGRIELGVGLVDQGVEVGVRVADALAEAAGLPVDAQPVLGIGVVRAPAQDERLRRRGDVLGQSGVGGRLHRIEFQVHTQVFLPLGRQPLVAGAVARGVGEGQGDRGQAFDAAIGGLGQGGLGGLRIEAPAVLRGVVSRVSRRDPGQGRGTQPFSTSVTHPSRSKDIAKASRTF